MRYKTYHRVLVIVVPILSLLLLYFAAVFVINHFTLPPCPSYYFLHIHCAGCGSTRSVIALTHGNLLLAIRQNLAIPAMILLGVVYYVEFALRVWNVKVRFPLIHSTKFIYILLALWFVYAVARNFIPQIAPISY